MSDKQVFMRAYPAQIEQSGPQQLTGRLVPYDVSADVLDLIDGKPDIYREGFRRGAFDGQVTPGRTNSRVLTKIGLIHRHEVGPDHLGGAGLGYLGPFVGLRDEPDGLWGDVNILPSKSEDVLSLLQSGVDELSVEFMLRGEPNTDERDGVRWRTRAHLMQVALEPKGAYRGAQVIALRAEIEDHEREAHEHDEADAEARAKAEQDRRDAEEIAAAQLAEADARLARRSAWDELTARIDGANAAQRDYVKQYGVTVPGYRR